MTALFTTERLSVRKFIPDDYDDLADILTDTEVTYFEPYETFTREACVQEAINFSKSEEFFAVVLNDKVIGKIYFSDKGFGSYEIGYTFNRNFQGKGYAYESICGMMKYAFSALGIRKEAEHKELFPRKENNEIYNDFYIYAILKREFKY